MLATCELARRKDLWHGTVLFSAVVDEEAYSIGARALVDSGVQADYCVVAESAFEVPVIGAAGKVLVRGDVHGEASPGYGARRGVNAAVEAAKFVARVDELSLGQHPRIKVTQFVLSLHSGNEQYVITVPEHARFTINRHIVPGETGETVLAQMRDLAGSLDSPARFDLSIDPPYYPPWEIAPDHPFIQEFAAAYETEVGHAPRLGYSVGVADANYFAHDLGIPTVHFGPHGANFHQADEWVDVPSIATTTRILLRLALAVLQ
jgi:acetylornithine deacetylase/succinyl-diaminopimelate desuccinylase-like protein